MNNQQQQPVDVPTMVFFADHDDKSFTTLDDLKAHLKAENPTIERIDRSAFPNLKFDKDSNNFVTLDWGKGPVKLRDTGFSRLCKTVKAPENFLTELPLDNIRRDIVARLLSMEDLQGISAIIKNDLVVGISKKENPFLAIHVLEHSDFFGASNTNTFRQIGINNNRIVIDLTSVEHSPLPSDAFGFGISVVQDDTQGTYPMISPYAFRLACANGAIHKKTFGTVKFSNRMSSDKFFESFAGKANEVSGQMFNEYANVLNTVSTTAIEEDEKAVIGEFLADTLDWENGIDGRSTFDSDITRKGTATYYDLMNFVTSFANQLDIFGRRRAQMLGVEVFDYFKGTESELFKGYAEFKREFTYNHT